MKDWCSRYKGIVIRLRHLAIVGNCFLIFSAAWELWWMGWALSSVDSIASDLWPYIIWNNVAALLVVGLCIFRVLALGRMIEIGFNWLSFSGLFLSCLLLVYWADSINLWTCYIYDPGSLACFIFDMGRADVLAAIGPIYVGIAIFRNIVVFTISRFA